MAVSEELPTSVSLMRIISHGLVPATSAPSVTEAVRRQMAIQGQQVSAVPHALLARCAQATREEVRHAFDSVQLVRSWPMRGTIHVTTADDHHWLRSALLHRYERDQRSLDECGVDQQLRDKAGTFLLEEIHACGPVSSARAIALWTEHGLMEKVCPASKGASVTEAWEASWRRRRILQALHLDGVIVQAPVGKNEHLLVDASVLPDETNGPAQGEKVAKGKSGHPAAMTEIARRYATSHGPVSARDLARWLAVPVGECSRALEAAVESTQSHEIPLMRVRVSSNGLGVEPYLAPVNARQISTHALYMRADLPDLLSQSHSDAVAVHYLGMFDELHVGYKERTCLTDEVGERLICPGKNGIFLPFFVDRGRLVAVEKAGEILWGGGSPVSARVERAVHEARKRMRERLL